MRMQACARDRAVRPAAWEEIAGWRLIGRYADGGRVVRLTPKTVVYDMPRAGLVRVRKREIADRAFLAARDGAAVERALAAVEEGEAALDAALRRVRARARDHARRVNEHVGRRVAGIAHAAAPECGIYRVDDFPALVDREGWRRFVGGFFVDVSSAPEIDEIVRETRMKLVTAAGRYRDKQMFAWGLDFLPRDDPLRVLPRAVFAPDRAEAERIADAFAAKADGALAWSDRAAERAEAWREAAEERWSWTYPAEHAARLLAEDPDVVPVWRLAD